MTESQDLTHISYRLDKLENTVGAQTTQYTEIKVEMGKMDAAITGVREQAKAHNEASSRAIAELSSKFIEMQLGTQRIIVESQDTTKKLIADGTRELQGSVDLIVKALGLDEDPKAGRKLGDNLTKLSVLLEERKDTISWIKRGIIGSVVSGSLLLLYHGIMKVLGR